MFGLSISFYGNGPSVWIKLCGPRMFVILRIELTKQVSTKNKKHLISKCTQYLFKALSGEWSSYGCNGRQQLELLALHSFDEIKSYLPVYPAPSWFGSTPMVWSAQFAHQFPWHLTWLGSMWVRAWVTTCSSGNAGWASSSGNFWLGMVRDCLRIRCLR